MMCRPSQARDSSTTYKRMNKEARRDAAGCPRLPLPLVAGGLPLAPGPKEASGAGSHASVYANRREARLRP